MDKNRRQHERINSDHPAELLLDNRLFAKCRVCNYSHGGLHLQMSTADIERLKPHAQEATSHSLAARVHIHNQQDPADPPFKMPIHITFTSERGIGAAFLLAAGDMINYLTEHGQTTATEQSTITTTVNNSKSGETLNNIRQQLSDFLQATLSPMRQAILESLAEHADLASQQEQTELLFAHGKMERNAASIYEQFSTNITANWEQLKERPQSSSESLESMELVNQDEFDQWTTVVRISRHIESQLPSRLHAITQCLAYLTKRPLNNENNPLSPYTILWSYKRALDSVNIGSSAKEVIYNVFGEMLLVKMGPLIKQIYATLEESGTTTKAQTKTTTSTPTTDQDSSTAAQRTPHTVVNTLASTLNGTTTTSNLADYSNQTAISSAMDNMALNAESQQIIDVTRQLLGAAQQDSLHSTTMCQLLQQVQLPMAKAAIQDPAVLNDKNHPAQQLLNNIGQLALLSPNGHDSQLQPLLNTLSEQGKDADLQQLTEQIRGLLEQRRGDFSSNLKQVVAGYSAEQRERESILQTREFLQQELSSTIAVPVDKILQLGWGSLLVETTTQGESKAQRLQNYKQVILLLTKAFHPKSSSVNLYPNQLKQLSKLIRLGFKTYPLYQKESELLIQQIDEALTKNRELFQQLNGERIEVTSRYLQQLLPLRSITATAQNLDIDPEWQQQINDLRIGDWITDHQQHGKARVLSLAWRSEDNSHLAFVNGNGIKSLECSSNELATGLQHGRFHLIEDGGLPMVERAIKRALKKNFEKLRQESDLDELTGLQNRRAYKRELQRLIADSRQEQSQHVLICMDIDKFSLVNEICGNDGGDKMLANIANICRSYLTQPDMLARTGDNEFSILIEHCAPDEGFRIAENQRRAIENYRFSWGEKEVSVTVSIGLTEITPDSGQPDDITQASRSACIQAKKDGQNCCRRYQLEVEEFSRRKIMAQSIPLIERALTENNLELHAQIIKPIFVNDGLIEHHEILLRRLDEQGAPSSPIEFIQAAEKYNRMLAVDRWVVQNFMQWAENTTKKHGAKSMGAFSINLSGQSMMDEKFGRFLLEQIKNSPIPPKQLAFEITETAVVNNINRVQKLMDAIHIMGSKLFLDDFGSGYASFSYLKDFPVDVVKIDGIFIKDIHQDQASRAMVKSITEVAHNMDKLVVAEFAESDAILTVLREIEVDYAQGYSVGHPLPLQALVL